jgi:hypothetical protein
MNDEQMCTPITVLELRRVLQTLTALETNLTLLVLEMWQSGVTLKAVSRDLQRRILRSLVQHGIRMEAAVGDTHQILLSRDYVANGGHMVLGSMVGFLSKPHVCLVPMWVRDLGKDIPTATDTHGYRPFIGQIEELRETDLNIARTGRPRGQRCIAVAPCHGSPNSLLQIGCDDVHCGKACGDVTLVIHGSLNNMDSFNLWNIEDLPVQVTPRYAWGDRVIRMAGQDHPGLATFKVQKSGRMSEDLVHGLTNATLFHWSAHVPASDRKLETVLRSRVGCAKFA